MCRTYRDGSPTTPLFSEISESFCVTIQRWRRRTPANSPPQLRLTSSPMPPSVVASMPNDFVRADSHSLGRARSPARRGAPPRGASRTPGWVELGVCLLFLTPATLGAGEPRPEVPTPAPRKSVASLERDWPGWRGPSHNGVAPTNQDLPLEWSPTTNIIWKSPVPGRGHASPIVVGDYVYLPTAELDKMLQSVLCVRRDTGKRAWKVDVFEGGLVLDGNRRASHASSTMACDGERLYVNFLNRDAVFTTALTLDGKKVWQRKISDYVVHQGYGASPFVYRSLLLVIADNKGGGAVCALNRTNGEVVWRVERPKKPNYPSPIVLTVAGRDQMVLTGCDLVTGLDPLTGKKIWEIEGATTECVTTTVTDGTHIFTSGGYPDNHVSAVRADGSGKVTWRNGVRVYVPSMLQHGGYLYAVTDAGVAHCWKAATGEVAWKGRLGGTFNASLVLAGDRIYAVNEKGRTFVVKATPKEFKVLARNQLGNEVFATPAACGDRLYMRAASGTGEDRREMLYCIGVE